MTDLLRKKIIDGVKWSALGQFGTQGVVMASSIVLARLLSPNEFGLIAIVTVIIGFASYFSNFGLSTAIIQKKEVSEEDLSSVFWINSIMGIVLTVIFIAASDFISFFFKEPILQVLLIPVSFTFLLNSLIIVNFALLNRNSAFKALAFSTFFSVLISYTVAILLAFFGFGIWSLVCQGLTNSFFLALFYFYFSSWRPKPIFNKASIKSMQKMGFHIFSISILDYLASNIDTILIGKFINKKQLGEYGRANAFLMLPVVNVTSVIAKVIMPTLSQIQGDNPRVANIYFKVARLIALITFPMMIGLAVVANPFVYVVFGEKWLGMIPMLQWFSIMGVIVSLGSLHDPVIVSQGRTDLLFKFSPFEKGFLVAAVFAGINWGVYGVIIGKTVANFISMISKVVFVSKTVDVKIYSVFFNIFLPFVLSVCMGLTVWIFNHFCKPILSMEVLLFIDVIIGILVYVLLVFMFDRTSYQEIKLLINGYIGAKNKI